jgi:Flp pilus assembly protein TadD
VTRRFLVSTMTFGAGLLLGGLSGSFPARAQDLPEVWQVRPQTSVPDSIPPDALFYYFEGNDRAFAGDPAAAILLYRRALALDTTRVEVRLALARAYAASSQFDSTLYWAEEARRRDPGRAEAQRLAGFAYLRLRRSNDAIGALQRAIELDPSDTGSMMNLLYLFESSQRYQEALALIGAAPEDMRESPSVRVRRARLLVQVGRPAEAVVDLVSLLKVSPDYPEGEMILSLALTVGPESVADTSGMESLLREQPMLDRARSALARIYLETERYAAALPHLELLAAHEPEDRRVLRDLGVLLFRLGEYEKAEARFRDLEKGVPGDPEALRWLCRVAVMRERPEDAIKLATRVQAGLPNDPAALLCEATAYLAMKRREEALQAAEKVLAANPANREAGLLAGAVLEDLGRPGEAVELLRPVVSGHPGDRTVLFAFGALLERANQVDSSLAVFDRLLAANPDDDEVLNHSGYICIDRGIRIEEGMARVKRALALAPERGAYIDSYGWGLFRLGRHAEALEWLGRAAEKSPGEPEIRLHQGEVLEAMDRPADARAAYREALRLRPGDPAIRGRLDGVGRRPAGQPAP